MSRADVSRAYALALAAEGVPVLPLHASTPAGALKLVRDLCQRGLSAAQIAEELGLELGRVEAALASDGRGDV